MALLTFGQWRTASPDGSSQVINHLWCAKGIGTNNVYVLEVDPSTGGFPFTPTQPAGRTLIDTGYLDYSSSNVTTGATTTVIASTAGAANLIEIFDTSGQVMQLYVAGSAKFYIPQGGNGQLEFAVGSGVVIGVRAKTATATSGTIVINLYS